LPRKEYLMKKKTSQSIPIELAKLQFLEQMVNTHGLPDIGKAVRCLIDYARAHPEHQASIFGEVRCPDC